MHEDLSNFPYFAPYWTPKGVSPLFEQTESPSPSMFPAKFGWNWLSGSWEEDVWRKVWRTDGH